MYDPKQRRLAATAVLLAVVFLFYLSQNKFTLVVVDDDDDGSRSSSSLRIYDAYTAQVFWNYCGMDLIHVNKAIEGTEQCKPGEANCGLQTTKYLHPNMKESLRDCVLRINLPTRVRGDPYEIWYTKYLERLLPVSDVPRRYLASGILKSTVGPAASPSSSLLVPSATPSPMISVSPPSLTPSVALSTAPTGEATPGSNSGSYKSSSKRWSVAIAVGVTVPVTLIISALLIFCYIKFCKRGNTLRRNDNKPLLSLSLQELSDGPRKSSSFVPFPNDKDKRNGRVVDQTNNDSSLNGDLYPHSHFVSEFDSQSSGFRFSGWSDVKLSSESHATPSSVAPYDQKPVAPPGMIKIPPPAPRPPRASDASPKPPLVDSSRPHAPNTPPPAPTTTVSAGVFSLNPMPPPPPMVKPITAPPKPPAPPQPTSSFSDARPPPLPHRPLSATARPPPPPPPRPPSEAASPHPPPPPPPRPPSGTASPRPPPPPGSGPPPPRPPPPAAPGPRPPLAPGHFNSQESESSAAKPKLKPFFWDKVLANPDSSMVWNQIKSGSFQFNEDMIEALFGSAPVDKNKNERKGQSAAKDPPVQHIQLIDTKKAQNLSILLRALNLTTEEVCDALLEGYELPTEFFETLLKMAPTQEEELKLRMFNDDISLLGPAERFLKGLVDIPFAFQRIECLIFATSIQEEVSVTKHSFATLEVACKELRNSRLFSKLLEAVLKTGNRMNDGTFRGGAQAFKLDTLLKLSDVKGTDGKTTLLHFVVQEIIRSEGKKVARAAREAIVDESEDHLRSLGLEVVSHLSSELENVKKAAALDADSLTMSVARLKNSLNKTRSFLESNSKSMDEESGFYRRIKDLVQKAEVDVSWLVEEEKRIMGLIKSTGSYFHGNAGKDEGLHLFAVVRDFLKMVDKVCREVKISQSKPVRTTRAASLSPSPSTVSDQTHKETATVVDMRQRLFPAIADRRVEFSDSDDETQMLC